ncbi:ROK family transcriptional regulator [Actinopolyspora erythraea]|uniref:ROK family transcriptional regulator n=1 Tax=Actinopolyspora erythraea TaxID=414996 RepID=A0ABR4X4C7_9ACTN|nr:ROK family transcriptional regulator [Actinopolyspora erythraea]KGI81526.1 ROK family transcriptional regulator [Actinopolyspora erythraea]
MPRIALRPENAQQAQLLRLLRDHGPRSRAELGEAIRLSRSKLAHEIDRLTELEFVESGGFAASRGGRRSSIVRLSRDLRFVGVDIGATSVDVAVTNGELEVLGHSSAEIGVHNGPPTVLDTALDLLGKLRAEGVAPDIHGAGVGIPGPVSFREGVPVAPPIMPGWDQYPVRETMSQALGVPVQVDNDVNLMALGELHAGVARSVDDFLLVKIGTGIGCGIVVGGELHRGVSGSAGDIGHIQIDENGPPCACGNRGCLEAYASGTALARDAMAAARAGRSPRLAELLEGSGALSAADVTDAVSVGDPVAVQLLRDGGHRVGQVLASLVSFFNPGLVVVAGGVAGAGHSLLAEMRSAVYRRSLPLATGNLPIVLSELAAAAGVVGGARLISDQVLSVPRGIDER